MKNKLLTLAGALALLAVLGHFHAKPLLAQVRAALVSNMDEPGRIPYTYTLSAGGGVIGSAPAVPPNKRLVITYVSAGAVQGARALNLAGNPESLPRAFIPVLQNGVAGQSTQIYFDAGDTPTVAVDGAVSVALVNLSGHLLNCSAAACAPLSQAKAPVPRFSPQAHFRKIKFSTDGRYGLCRC